MNGNQDQVREIFSGALTQGSPEERERFVAAACGQNADLRRQVESLLLAHSQAGGFLRYNFLAPNGPPIGEKAGDVVGRYKLLQQIGEGGFGVVFMAEQQEPVRRMVALKIIKAGMDTKEVVARFEAERQALALMDHANIARVLDGGTTAGGRPYFVMDLVKGIPITEFCERHQLPLEGRLRLFAKVCAGVQHAHQKGVIHRDLKPTNVLVTLHDGQPVPKVIDFGIAKAIGQKLTERTLFTRFEQLIGTPAYMSPEQAEWSGLDVDTRSDLYSLGVLLYELLTGTTPLEKDTLARAALDEVRRMIRDEDPPAPSTRLQALRQSPPGAAPRQPADPAALARRVRGDLDWIVLKCLEKNRARRYETVAGLVRDIERHLNSEPVTACPPSRAYLAGKFLRKHRVAVTAGAVVALAVSAGLVLALIGLIQARQANQRAQDQAAIAQAVNNFLIQDLLYQASPESAGGPDLTMKEVVDRAAARITGRFTNQPLVEAAIRFTLGNTYRWLDRHESAQTNLQRAFEIRARLLGPDHRETLAALEELALIQTNRLEGLRLLREVTDKSRAVLGADDELTLNCSQDLAARFMDTGQWDEAEQILTDSLQRERRLHGPDSPRALTALHRLACVSAHHGRYAEALAADEQVLRAPHVGSALYRGEALNLIGTLYCWLGEYRRGIEYRKEQIEFLRQHFGPQTPHLRMAVSDRAYLHGIMGQWTRCLNDGLTSWTNWLDLPIAANLPVAALLAGDTNAYRRLVEQLIKDPASLTNQSPAFVVFASLRPDLVADLEPVLGFADTLPAEPLGELSDNNIAKGIAAYRRGQYAGALRWFDGWRRDHPGDSLWDGLAGCFCAMSHYRLGDGAEARADLEKAGSLIQGALRSGELNLWPVYGAAAVIRAEAERMILCREVSQIVDADGLASARARWAPVRRHLNEGDRLALDKDWRGARNEYLAAVREPAFDWEAAEAAWPTGNSISATRVGIVLLLAGDKTNHEQLCLDLFRVWDDHYASGYAWHFLRTCLAGGLNPPGELYNRVHKEVGFFQQHSGKVTPEAVSLIRAMAAYRAGRYQEAVDAAQIEGRLSVRNAARICRAMALARLGRWDPARTDLRAAEGELSGPLKRLTGDLWWDVAMCQVLLNEAHQVFDGRD